MEIINLNAKITESSFITKISYNEKKELLKVKIGRKIYSYHEVPASTVEEFIKSYSLGHYFSTHIKNHFPLK